RAPGRETATARMLVFHGNAGYALHRRYCVHGLHALGNGWDVILFEYPGYGARNGTASAKDFRDAATAAIALLSVEDDRPLYLLGESLGSGVASYIAASAPEQVAGLLLVTPFTSLAEVAEHHYPILPIRALLRENFNSVESLQSYDGPVAFLVAGSDQIVPTELGQKLHDGYQGRKWLRIVPGAGHNTLPMHPGDPWWAEASAFLGVD
ncbi:MAG: alpha/beta fold hydrolase, partial [Halioglobus sp.]|nr:alpha/beta fold hydrolase [Halioglobus sp.]